jgi:hypothetical protein
MYPALLAFLQEIGYFTPVGPQLPPEAQQQAPSPGAEMMGEAVSPEMAQPQIGQEVMV